MLEGHYEGVTDSHKVVLPLINEKDIDMFSIPVDLDDLNSMAEVHVPVDISLEPEVKTHGPFEIEAHDEDFEAPEDILEGPPEEVPFNPVWSAPPVETEPDFNFDLLFPLEGNEDLHLDSTDIEFKIVNLTEEHTIHAGEGTIQPHEGEDELHYMGGINF